MDILTRKSDVEGKSSGAKYLSVGKIEIDHAHQQLEYHQFEDSKTSCLVRAKEPPSCVNQLWSCALNPVMGKSVLAFHHSP